MDFMTRERVKNDRGSGAFVAVRVPHDSALGGHSKCGYVILSESRNCEYKGDYDNLYQCHCTSHTYNQLREDTSVRVKLVVPSLQSRVPLLSIIVAERRRRQLVKVVVAAQ